MGVRRRRSAIFRDFAQRLVVALVAVGEVACDPVVPAAEPARGAAQRANSSDDLAAATLGPGLVAWESNRSGAWRIWIRELAGGAPRQLSRDEAGRDHCCPHLSPDGERIIYLSLPGEQRNYPSGETPGELHLARTAVPPVLWGDGASDRVVSPQARHNGENRAAIWWSDDELVYLSSDGSTLKLDLSLGRTEKLAPGSADGEAWLIEPTGRFATAGKPTFSPRDANGKIRRSTPLGGCQPYFTADGEYGYWTAGAGGPIDRIDLVSRETRSVLRRNHPQLPDGWRYLYFPMISRDRSLLVYGASDGTHDHFRADYEIFAIELDPERLEPIGAPVRITTDPAVDRYPDVWRLAPPRRATPRTAATARAPAEFAAPDDADPPILLWRGATEPNQRSSDSESELLEEHGAVWFDRLGRLTLAGGFAATTAESAQRVDRALHGANTLSIALVVEPQSIAPGAGGPIATLATSVRQGGFSIRQRGDRIQLLLRTGKRGLGESEPIELTRLPDGAAHHVAFRFSPGRLTALLDGRPVHQTVVAGDFFHWKNGALRFGSDSWSEERFRGALSDVAIWASERRDEDLAAEANRALSRLSAAAPVARSRVTARLTARSKPATLEEISPYRRALVVEEYRLVSRVDGDPTPEQFRVARWSLLDGAPSAEMAIAVGATVALTLEPFSAQPQLESVVLSDTLPPAPADALLFSVGLGEE